MLRGIDWCNRRYGELQPILEGCRGEVEQRHRANEGPWGVEEFRLASVTYGDLTGDGREDALLILERTLRPIVHSAGAPNVSAEVWLMQRRGDDLFEYTTESAPNVPSTVAIADGSATLVWRQGATTCDEHWRFGGEGRSAVKSARHCGGSSVSP